MSSFSLSAAAAILTTAAALSAGCAASPLPTALTFRDTALTRGGEWSEQGVSGVVFVGPGQTMPGAALQVGVIHSADHASGEVLHQRVMQSFIRSGVVTYHVDARNDEACKAGVSNPPSGPRPFLAIHVCRTGVGQSACAEVDEQISGGDVACLVREECARTMCAARWAAARAELDPIVTRVLTTP
jgi:hypothetical protein